MKILRKQESLIEKTKQTKRTIIILILLIGFGISVNAQSEKTNHLGINLISLFGNTMELGYGIITKPNLSFDIYSGYVFNSKLSSPFKKGTQYDLENKSGFFIKIGARYNLRKDLKKLAPFIGLNIVNAIAIEKGIYDPDFDSNTPNEPVVKNSYNLGLNGVIGITSPAIKRINVDLGLQIGTTLINNLLDFHSYMPGMGVNLGSGLRIQGILRIKYLII
ncbi:MAG: hypothetical protein HN704_09100 [Bacteroidetes bacterium]|jgi:hypothetical protein|nr:hypothetical protein [Bacteroidota bacterium]MBT7141956.1 hypothetical protein [Bacteroidota bacterium]MBT7491749.1 hypothetical protein [Bacteroidota bacterium]